LLLTSEQTMACVPEDVATPRLVIDATDTIKALNGCADTGARRGGGGCVAVDVEWEAGSGGVAGS
jgi:hypothetical protein